ncbi:MAG: prepilin-type N-terminal cleavage/methylation domain-containing protein [Hydrogenophilales bacterium]|nr:prepilin-type N-terminal cleavage/methylation domain-containing protein [Hydrogenophilales bacterium]
MIMPARQSGFTLLELMIGLALLGMLLLLLFGALRLGSRSWDAGEARLSSASSQTVVAGFLRRRLSRVYPLRFKRAEGQALAFEGEPTALRFAGRIPTRQGIAGLHLLALELESDELILRWSLPGAEVVDFSGLDGTEKTVVLRGVKDVAWSYFGAMEAEADPVWQDVWHSDKNLPVMIRLTLTPTEGKPWPEIVVAPMLPSTANCVWDDFYKRCRNTTASSSSGGKSATTKPLTQ